MIVRSAASTLARGALRIRNARTVILSNGASV